MSSLVAEMIVTSLEAEASAAETGKYADADAAALDVARLIEVRSQPPSWPPQAWNVHQPVGAPKRAPVYTRWWFLLVAVALVASAAIAGVLFLTPR